MKKLLQLFFIMIATANYGQNLVLTQAAYEPVIGDTNRVYIMDTTFYFAGMPVDITGDGVTWNFTGLVETTTVNTTSYLDPATQTISVPANCDIVQKQGSSYSFLNSVTTPTTQTELLGTTFGSITATFTNPAIAARYPIDYGYALGDAFAGTATTVNVNGSLITTADGRGTLQLPYGNTYNNVLMVKSVQTVTATVFIIPVANITTTSYQFYHVSSKFPILTVTRSSTTFSTQTTLSSSASVNKAVFIIGVKENNLNQLQFGMFPNPATKQIQVQIADNLVAENVIISDCMGRELIHQNNSNMVNTQNLAPGIYFVNVKAKGYSGVKRLIISE